MTPSVRLRALTATLLFHLALLLILMYTVIHTPDPPLGGGEGMIVNIGFSEEGSGEIQPLSEEVKQEVHIKEVTPPPAPEKNNFVTQENEESEKIETSKEAPKEIKKESESKTTKTTPEKKPVEEVKKVNPDALYKGKKNNASSQGNDIGKKGDKGSPDGDPNSKYYGKSGTGNTPGDGSGTGSGSGSGNGPGFSFSLSGRKLLNSGDLKIDDKSQETGKVVVEITVDKYGKVSKAIPGGRGSTTSSSFLYKKAQQAAMKAKFDPSPSGTEEQKGFISFTFIVR